MLAALTNEAATLNEAKKLADAAAAAAPKSAPNGKDPEASTSSSEAEVKKEEVDDDDERGLVPDAPRTAEEAETEATHLKVLLAYIDELFGPTCVSVKVR